MKLNKKQAGLIAGVVCVILLIILLLSMCKSSGGQNDPSQPMETTGAAVETTQSIEETTEATEATTEAREETTEATEEATEPTTGGSTSPGGTGGPGLSGGGSTDDSTSTQPTTPKAGSEESPYMEVVTSFPDSVNTVSIPAEGAMYYNLNLSDESVATYGESLLVIAAEDACVIYNDTKYQAENGVVSVPLAAVTEEDTPIAIQICNTGKEAKSFALSLDAPLGTVDNPAQIRGENGEISIDAALEAGDEDGYHYGFEAERDGTLKLQLDSVSENVNCDIIVTAGETSVTLSSGAEEPSVTVDFKKGDMVTVQVIAKAAEDGTYPAAEVKVSGIADYYGSKTNPIVVKENFTTEEMEPGMVLYYLVEDQSGMALNVQDPAYVIYNDKTYQAPVSEDAEEEEPVVISVKIGNSDDSALMAIGNGGEESAEFDVSFGYPVGHVQNKAPMTIKDEENQIDGINTAVIESGDTDVYWFTWTNEMDTGILTIQMPAEGNWKYAVNHTSGEKTTAYDVQYSDSDPVQRTISLLMEYEDVVEIQVCTYDPADKAALPVGSVTFEASFLPHTLINATGETWVTLEGGSMIYCKQGLKYADGAIMTVVAVETDEEGNAKLDDDGNVIVLTDRDFTIDYEGTVYNSTSGTIIIEGIEMESTNPDVFSFLNDSTENTTYRISFSYPEGNMSNPIPIELGRYSVTLYGDGTGSWYTWTVSKTGIYRFEILSGDVWVYNIATTKDATVYTSTKNLDSTDAVAFADIQVEQSHLDESEDGTVVMTINVGNPVNDAENQVDVVFEAAVYNEVVTKDSQIAVAAGQTWYLRQELENKAVEGMAIAGVDTFTVVYDGQSYTSQNGIVNVENFTTNNVYFQITNGSSADQTYTLTLSQAEGSENNPEKITAGDVELDLFTIGEGYYYAYEAPADGTFDFAIPSSHRRKAWAYEITHGEDIYSGKRPNGLTQSFAVNKGDLVTLKFTQDATITQSSIISFSISFTEAVEAAVLNAENPLQITETQYVGKSTPAAFAVSLDAGQQVVSIDLTQKYELYFDENNGCYHLSENGPAVLVDFSSDAFVNLKKQLETTQLYCEITAEDGAVTKETYNTLLQKYIDCAAVIQVSENETKTLYPLTEDLMYILKNVGKQLGWYDSTSSAYLFAEVSNAEADSLWMFSCCCVQTVEVQSVEAQSIPAETAVTTEQPVDITTEETTEETSEPEETPTDSQTE